jgi:hypothetical protein
MLFYRAYPILYDVVHFSSLHLLCLHESKSVLFHAAHDILCLILLVAVQIIEAAKKRGAEKAKLTKSMIVLDVKPWDDTTDMAELEKEVRSIVKDGLLWGSCELSNTCMHVKQQLHPVHVAVNHAHCWSSAECHLTQWVFHVHVSAACGMSCLAQG